MRIWGTAHPSIRVVRQREWLWLKNSRPTVPNHELVWKAFQICPPRESTVCAQFGAGWFGLYCCAHTGYYRIYFIDSCQILHKDKTTKNSVQVVWICPANPRWWTTTILKTLKLNVYATVWLISMKFGMMIILALQTQMVIKNSHLKKYDSGQSLFWKPLLIM